MKKVVSLALFPMFLLSACGAPVGTPEKVEKKPFQVEVKSVSDFTKEYNKEKT